MRCTARLAFLQKTPQRCHLTSAFSAKMRERVVTGVRGALFINKQVDDLIKEDLDRYEI